MSLRGSFLEWIRKPIQSLAKSPPDPDRAQVHVKRLVFSDGVELELQRNSIVVFTGANNVGKSTALRETYRYLKEYSTPRRVISKVTTEIQGQPNDFRKLIEAAGLKPNSRGEIIREGYRDYKLSDVEEDFKKHFVGTLPMSFFATYLNASDRLTLTHPVARIDYRDKSPEHPSLWLELDDSLLPRIQSIFQKTFYQTLQMNIMQGSYLGFSVIPSEEIAKKDIFASSRDYYYWINTFPSLESQGDGMRSFTGALLALLVHPRNIVFMDEPEAFLHPPQAKKLAEMFAEETDNNSQLFLATHEMEIVRALLDAAGDRVVIVRIRRDGNKNSVTVMDNNQVRHLWRDPLLRTSSVLSSLFGEITIFCEGETDARFFKVLLDATRGERRESDYQFHHVGGKDRIAEVVKALRALNVPVIAIVDIDILADQNGFKRLYESFGGQIEELQADLQIISSAISSKRKLNYAEFAEKVEKIAQTALKSKDIGEDMLSALTVIKREASVWQQIKMGGRIEFNGENLKAFDRIADKAMALGLIINPEGELEGFCRTVSRARKSEWLSRVVEMDVAKEKDFESARKFATVLRYAMDTKMKLDATER